MRTVPAFLVAGVALIAVAGCSGWARAQTAQNPYIHTITVRLPGGRIEQIRYAGNTPPQISVDAVPAASIAFAPMPFGPGSPFAAFDRISAQMDREAAALLRQTAALAATGSGIVDTATLAPGSREYTAVSTLSGNGVCTESVQITATGNGPPQVIRHSSGNCAPGGGAGGTIALPAARSPRHRPDLVMTKAEGAKPYAGLVREIPVSQR